MVLFSIATRQVYIIFQELHIAFLLIKAGNSKIVYTLTLVKAEGEGLKYLSSRTDKVLTAPTKREKRMKDN